MRALIEKGFAAAAARRAAERLAAEGWLDDLSAARSLVRVRASRYGRDRIARELSARGFSAEAVREALEAELPEREGEALLRAFSRLWKEHAGRPASERARRVRQALLRRGFAPGEVSAMIRGSHETERGS
jgi:SOS response regulatory protein OraA/RecX